MRFSKLHMLAALMALLAFLASLLLGAVTPPKVSSYAQVLPNGKIVIDKALIEGVEQQYPSLMRNLLWLIGNGRFAEWAMPFTEESIVAEARRRSGLGPETGFWFDKEAGEALTGPENDVGSYEGTYWYSRLKLLLKAIREEGSPHFSAFGRFVTRDTLVEALANQMRAVDLVKKHPEILQENIDRPIIITGPPRTMTTHAQSILATHPDTIYLRFSESRDPIQPPGLDPKLVYTSSDPRAKLVNIGRGLLWYSRPFFRYMFRTDETNPGDSPNEDIFLSLLAFGTPLFESQSYVPSYSKVWLSQDNRPAFRFQKLLQKIIQWQERRRIGSTNKRWLMKTPEHSAFLQDLISVYPDAFVVLTHRDPVPVVASFLPMIIYTSGFWNSIVDAAKFGEFGLDVLEKKLNRLVAQVDMVPQNQIFHVPFKKFVDNNFAVVEEVCRFAGLNLTEEAVARMKGYIERSPREGANRFEYRAETFSRAFNKDALRERFAKYSNKFKSYI